MRRIAYDEDDLTLLRSMLRREFAAIFYDGSFQHAFAYGEDHILARPWDLPAATQNDFDEAITIKFEKKEGPYEPSEHDQMLFHDQSIDHIWIARTVLYFTDSTPFASEEEAMSRIPNDGTPTHTTLREILRECQSHHEEVVCHPQAVKDDEEIRSEYANLVDAGVLMQIGDQFLSCFSRGNGFILPDSVMTEQEIKEDDDIGQYEFIAL